MSDSDKQRLATQLTELSRASSGAAKLISCAENALENGNLFDKELLVMNLEKLKAVSLEAEEVLIIYHGHSLWAILTSKSCLIESSCR